MWRRLRSTYRKRGSLSDLSDGEWERLAQRFASEAWRAAAQDRHAFGDDAIFYPCEPVAMALFARRDLSAAFDGLQHLPRLPARGRVGGDLGGTARGPARTAGAGGEPQRRGHRQLLAQVGRKRGCAKGEADAVGYDAGKKVRGAKCMPSSTSKACRCAWWFTPPPSGSGWRRPGVRWHPPALQLA